MPGRLPGFVTSYRKESQILEEHPLMIFADGWAGDPTLPMVFIALGLLLGLMVIGRAALKAARSHSHRTVQLVVWSFILAFTLAMVFLFPK